MVDCPTSAGAGLHSQQIRISGCVMSLVWMAIEEFAEPLCLWFCVFR